MSNALDQATIAQFRRDGFHYPHAGIGAARAQAARAELEAYEAASGGRLTALSPSSRYTLHVKLPWAHANSINGAGQSIVDAFDDSSSVRATLRVGEFSLHHTLCVHSSPPNASRDRRIGLGISYIPTRVRHIGTVRQRAMLVRGKDSFGHFDLEPPPGTNTNENKVAHELSLQHYNDGYAEQMDWHEAGRLHAEDSGWSA